MTTDELKKRIAALFQAARAEGPIVKWADGITDAQEVMDLNDTDGKLIETKEEYDARRNLHLY